MKNKKVLKFIANFIKKPWVKFGVYLLCILLILNLSYTFGDNKTFGDTILHILTSEDTLSLFFAALASLGLAKVISWFDKYMEDSLKTEDNHHKIISQYRKHKLGGTSYQESFAAKEGEYLVLTHTPTRQGNLDKQEKLAEKLNDVKDVHSKEYKSLADRIARYFSGELCLSSLNVFANISADTEIRFNDSPEKHDLPSFVISNANEILQAHKNSTKNNSTTIRLNDFHYQDNTLVLDTSRSTYYHMLITNRCMDYKFANGLSIREVYEYDEEICPIERSKLGNQIGINGLIVTKDNYILIEKRGHKKITWKNKFAQSISLALKLKDLKLERRDALENDAKTAEDKLKYIIGKTIKDNFGLTSEDYAKFTIKENFLGLARDLLEGGKPNLYFYVQTNLSACDLKEKLENNVRWIEADNVGKPETEQKPVIATSKLESEYYLVPFDAVNVDFSYKMSFNKKDVLRVCRKLHPRCTKIVEWWDRLKEKCGKIFSPTLTRECGEALLVTLAYLELRWDWWQKKKTEEAKTNEQ